MVENKTFENTGKVEGSALKINSDRVIVREKGSFLGSMHLVSKELSTDKETIFQGDDVTLDVGVLTHLGNLAFADVKGKIVQLNIIFSLAKIVCHRV